MLGTAESPGVSFLALQRLFDLYAPVEEEQAAGEGAEEQQPGDVAQGAEEGADMAAARAATEAIRREAYARGVRTQGEILTSVRMACVEVYNEECRDLLAPTGRGAGGSGSGGVEVRKGASGRIELKGARWRSVSTAEQAFEVLAETGRTRSQGSTKANSHSSRSHFIVVVEVSTSPTTPDGRPIEGKVNLGRLFLVDLAGSERLDKRRDTASKVSERMVAETQHINRSLAALGDVIEALAKSANFVPYRNSKLTFLLQVGGRCCPWVHRCRGREFQSVQCNQR